MDSELTDSTDRSESPGHHGYIGKSSLKPHLSNPSTISRKTKVQKNKSAGLVHYLPTKRAITALSR